MKKITQYHYLANKKTNHEGKRITRSASKNINMETNQEMEVDSTFSTASLKRGRPKKNKSPSPTQEEEAGKIKVTTSTSTSTPAKQRGRPRKMKKIEIKPSTTKGRGRPRKNPPQNLEIVVTEPTLTSQEQEKLTQLNNYIFMTQKLSEEIKKFTKPPQKSASSSRPDGKTDQNGCGKFIFRLFYNSLLKMHKGITRF
jgi:hypothetical protein